MTARQVGRLIPMDGKALKWLPAHFDFERKIRLLFGSAATSSGQFRAVDKVCSSKSNFLVSSKNYDINYYISDKCSLKIRRLFSLYDFVNNSKLSRSPAWNKGRRLSYTLCLMMQPTLHLRRCATQFTAPFSLSAYECFS